MLGKSFHELVEALFTICAICFSLVLGGKILFILMEKAQNMSEKIVVGETGGGIVNN